MFCERCGNRINPGEKFCSRCGAPQNVQSGSIPANQQQMSDLNGNGAYSQQQMPERNNEEFESDATTLLKDSQPVNGGFANRGAAQQMPNLVGAGGFENYAPVQENTQNGYSSAVQQGAEFNVTGNINVPNAAVKKKASKKKIFIISGIAAAAVALTVAGIIFIPKIFDGGADKYNGAFYITSGKLNVAYNGKKANKVSGPYISSSQSYYTSRMSADSKYMFYYDSMLGKFCRIEVKNGSFKDAVEIDSGVGAYAINPEGSRIMYIADGSMLYTSDMKEKQKISSDVKGFCTNSDLSAVVYQTAEDKKLYFKDKDKEPEKIANDAQLVFCSEDLSVIYYKKDNDLYMKKSGAEPKKIISDTELKYIYDNVSEASSTDTVNPARGIVPSLSVPMNCIYSVTKDGKFFYTTRAEKSLPASDFFEDDMADSDKNIKEPDPNDKKYKKKSSSLFSSYTDEYYELRDQYRNKETRDSFRERIKEENISIDVYQLYFYDGQKSTLVSDMVNFISYTPEQAFNQQGTVKYAENSVIVYSAYDKNSVEKVKMSELAEKGNLYTYYVTSEVRTKLLENNKFYSQNGKTSAEISGVSKMLKGTATSDLKSMYFIQPDVKEGSESSYAVSTYDAKGSLYKIDFADTKARKPKKLADDVGYVLLNKKDEPVTLRNVSSSSYTGDLYVSDKKIAGDVTGSYLRFYDDGSIVYFTDYRSSSNSGTLNIYDGSNTKKISDDVKDFEYVDSKNIYAIYDYSGSDGDLIFYNGNKSEKIDEDVSYFWHYSHMKKSDADSK